MPSLAELQHAFARAIWDGADGEVVGAIRGDGLLPEARVALYRHHVFTTLTAALAATYPVVSRLVDERFFAYAAGPTFAFRHALVEGRALEDAAGVALTVSPDFDLAAAIQDLFLEELLVGFEIESLTLGGEPQIRDVFTQAWRTSNT